ncbi:MAG: DUF302 domain-containing protein [Paracoccaceae bacterium]
MLKAVIFAGATLAMTMPAAAADLIRKSSPYSVAVTMDKLEAAVTGAGARVFARVDHAAGAASVDMELADAQLLIFGNPKLGTPAMQAGITSGLDLPLRVLVYQGAAGVELVYHDPKTLSSAHGIPSDAKVLKMMTGAMGTLTDKAID